MTRRRRKPYKMTPERRGAHRAMDRRGDQYALVTLRIHEEDGYFVSTCEELDVSSFGRTVDEALKQLQDAMVTHLTALEGEGILMATLEERGVEIRSEPVEVEIKITVHPQEIVSSRFVPVVSGLSAAAGAGAGV